MKNLNGIDEFWQIGSWYKHLSYKNKFQCIGFTTTHTILKSMDFTLEVPSIKRHTFMYKTGG